MVSFFKQPLSNIFILSLPAVTVLSAFLAPRFLAFLPIIFGLIGILSLCIFRKKIVLWKSGYILSAAAILLGAISISWSFNPEFSFERVTKLAPLLFAGLFLPSYFLSIKKTTSFQSHHFIYATLVPAGLGALCIIFEYYNRFPIYESLHPQTDMSVLNFFIYNRAVVALALICLPALAILGLYERQLLKKPLTIACLLPLIYALTITTSQTAQLGFIIGLIALFAFPVKNKAARIILIVTCIIGCLCAPVVIKKLHSLDIKEDQIGVMRAASVPHRIEVWNFALTEAMQNPYYGSGIGSLRFIESENGLKKYMKGTSVLHPHNVVVQAWQEFGLLGAVLLSIGCLFLLMKIFAQPHNISRLYLGMFSCYAMIALTGYSFWQSWILGAAIIFATLGFICVNLIEQDTNAATKPNNDRLTS